MLTHGERIIDTLGEEVDRIEKILKVRPVLFGFVVVVFLVAADAAFVCVCLCMSLGSCILSVTQTCCITRLIYVMKSLLEGL